MKTSLRIILFAILVFNSYPSQSELHYYYWAESPCRGGRLIANDIPSLSSQYVLWSGCGGDSLTGYSAGTWFSNVCLVNNDNGYFQYCSRYHGGAVECGDGEIYNSTDRTCGTSTRNQCADLAGNQTDHSWDYMTLGDNPTFCSNGCELSTVISACFVATGTCGGQVSVTGNQCQTGHQPGGRVPQAVPQGCQLVQGVYLCPEDSDGDGRPNNGRPLDTDATCGYNTLDQFGCSGGSYSDEGDYNSSGSASGWGGGSDSDDDEDDDSETSSNSNNNDPFDMPDPTNNISGVTAGPIGSSNSGLISTEGVGAATLQEHERYQIRLLNRHINSLLTDLNEDNNRNFKKVIDELINANRYNQEQLTQIVASTNKQVEIWNELKTLQMAGVEHNIDAINQLNANNQAYQTQMLSKQRQLLSAIRDLTSTVIATGSQGGNGIGNGNGSGSGNGNGNGNGNGGNSYNQQILNAMTNVTGSLNASSTAYTSQHTKQTLSEEMTNRLTATKDAIYNGMLSSFASVDLSSAAKPSLQLDLTGFGFGVFSLENYINFDYIFAVIRICILFTAAMTCRKLIFGG